MSALFRVGPFAYHQYVCEIEADESLQEWTDISQRLHGGLRILRDQIGERKQEAAQASRAGNKPLALRYMKDVQRLRQQETIKLAEQHKADVFVQELSGKDLSHDMFQATKRAALVMRRTHTPKDLKKLEADIGMIQEGMDAASDFREIMAEPLDGNMEVVTDEDLMAELEGEILQEVDSRLLGASMAVPVPYKPVVQPNLPSVMHDVPLYAEGAARTPGSAEEVEVVAPSPVSLVTEPLLSAEETEKRKIEALRARGITCAEDKYSA